MSGVTVDRELLAKAEKLWVEVDAGRLCALTLGWLQVPSPTGDEAAFAEVLAAHLATVPMQVEVTRRYPSSPNVIARHAFCRPGRTLAFDGHLDVIDIPNPTPRADASRVYGRGACDMKGQIACMAEAARILIHGAPDLAGTLMITAHSRHETPVGRNEPLDEMIARGQFGDAVIIGECGYNVLPVQGRGMSAYRITVARPGDVVHETQAVGVPNPLYYAARIVAALEGEAERLRARPDGPFESVFVGQIHGGDFFNRVPRACWLEGTWRHERPKSTAEIRQDLERVLAFTEGWTAAGMRVDLDVIPGPDVFTVSGQEPIALCLKAAYQAVHGRPLEEARITLCGNAPWFIRDAHVPCLYHGINQASAHSDNEYAELAEMVQLTKTYILTALLYLGESPCS